MMGKFRLAGITGLILAIVCHYSISTCIHTATTYEAKAATEFAAYMSEDTIDVPVGDSIESTPIDTSTPEGQLRFIKSQVDYEYSPTGSMYDTLVDVNYDGYKDYVLGFYYGCGTGIKNGAVVYTYLPQRKKYAVDTVLSYLPNPTFYISKKQITYFYLANGAGSGGRLMYDHGKWIKTMQFDVDNQEDKSVWDITFPLTGRKRSIHKDYGMLPPADILETGVTEDNYQPFL